MPLGEVDEQGAAAAQVEEKDAATKMIVQTYTISSGEKFSEKIILKDEKQKNLNSAKLNIVTAYNEKNEAVVVTDKISEDGSLNWKPSSGKWTVYVVFTGKTLQKVKLLDFLYCYLFS